MAREDHVMHVTLLYIEGCPNWAITEGHLHALQTEFAFDLERVAVETVEAARRIGFHGSPTVLADGHDPFVSGDEPTRLACRVYTTPEGLHGSPTLEQLGDVLSARRSSSGQP
jgi:hypothetical protein